MSLQNAVSAHALQGRTHSLLGALLDLAREESGVKDFLEELAALAKEELSRPGHAVSCGITVRQGKQAPIETCGGADASATSLRIPLALDRDRSAVVNFYGPRAQTFSAEDSEKAHQFAADASPALLLAMEITKLRRSRSDLAAAMNSRTIIDIAVGVIMAQNRCGREGAFKILRNTSNNRNKKIRDVAASVVASIAGDTDLSARFEE
jgi:hypothetical protein